MTQTIEERIETARQELASAQEVLSKYESIKKKKESLQNSFRYFMSFDDAQNRRRAGKYESCPREDPASAILYDFGEYLYNGKNKIKDREKR